MKTVNYILSAFAVLAGISLTSCVKDLDVTPIDPNLNTADKQLKTEADYLNVLAGVYTGYATSGYYGPDGGPSISGLDGGASQYFRGLFNLNELPTDEAVNNWNDQTIKDFHAMSWTTSDVFVYAFYSRVNLQISLCNEFIRQAKNFGGLDNLVAEARALRAMSYYHAIDNFGNVPFSDENMTVGKDVPQQISRADLFKWIETECKDLLNGNDLPAARTAQYGRIDKGAVKMILAKLYLNAGVYTGTPRWDDCADVLNSIMADGYSLHSKYSELFGADNDICTDEIIFAVEQDGADTQSYGVTNYIIFGSTGDGVNAADMGISSGWGGLRATDTFYNTFEDGDVRKMFSDDKFHKGPVEDVGDFTKGGHPSMKFKNITSTGNPGKAAGFVDTDFPVFRYADVLLMLAECGLNGSSKVSASAAQGYFNQVRARAGLGELELTADNLIAERGRELYHECWRRSDLIRFGKFTSSDFTWDLKPATVDAHRVLYPIPTQDITSNGNMVQNPGY